MDGTALDDAEEGLKDQVELERPSVGKPDSPVEPDPLPLPAGGGEALVEPWPPFDALFE